MSKQPNVINYYMPPEVQAMIEAHANGNASAYLQDLVRRDDAARAAAAKSTLLAQAGSVPIQTREKILAALTLCDGNGTAARAMLGAAEGDWRRAIEALALGEEIAKRWPARRAVQRKERHDGHQDEPR